MIEFRCQQCGATLRVPAGTEGKQAKCPQCGSLMTIPTPAPPPNDPFRPAPPPPSPADFSVPPPREGAFQQTGASSAPADDSTNPFQSPQYAGEAYLNHGAAPRRFQPSPIYFGEVFERSWQVFKANLGLLLGGGLLVFAITFFIDQIVQRLFGVESQRFDVGVEIRVEDFSSAMRHLAAGLVTQAVAAYFLIGRITMTLKIVRDEGASLADLFSAGPRYPQGALIHILFSFLTGLGFLLCFLPGVWFALAFGLNLYMYVDQRKGIVESFQYSYLATRGNKLTLFGLWLVMLGLMTLGAIACCVGVFVAMPFCGMLMTMAYLAATGQLPRAIEQPAPYTMP
jgi:hypothetical protein